MKKKVVYHDIINGESTSYTYEEMLEQVRENPVSTSPDGDFFFGSDGSSFSCQQVADILQIELIEE